MKIRFNKKKKNRKEYGVQLIVFHGNLPYTFVVLIRKVFFFLFRIIASWNLKNGTWIDTSFTRENETLRFNDNSN